MAGAAVLIGMGSWFLGPADFFPPETTPPQALQLLLRSLLQSLLVALLALSAVASLGVLFDPPHRGGWLVLAGILAVGLPVPAAIWLTHSLGFRPPGAPSFDFRIFQIFWMALFACQLGCIASTLATIWLLRAGGWRPAKAAPATPSAASPAPPE